jgi:hypothetical protein
MQPSRIAHFTTVHLISFPIRSIFIDPVTLTCGHRQGCIQSASAGRVYHVFTSEFFGQLQVTLSAAFACTACEGLLPLDPLILNAVCQRLLSRTDNSSEEEGSPPHHSPASCVDK